MRPGSSLSNLNIPSEQNSRMISPAINGMVQFRNWDLSFGKYTQLPCWVRYPKENNVKKKFPLRGQFQKCDFNSFQKCTKNATKILSKYSQYIYIYYVQYFLRVRYSFKKLSNHIFSIFGKLTI